MTQGTGPTAAGAGPALDLDRYGGDVETFLAELGEAEWASLTGTAPGGIGEVRARHAELFDDRALDSLRRAVEGAPPGERQLDARNLFAFAIDARLAADTAELTDRLDAAESGAIVVWRGQRLAYRSLPGRIAEIGDRAERNALYASYLEAVEATNPLREERREALQEAAARLGLADLRERFATLNGWDAQALAIAAQRFVGESETVYFAALRRYLAFIDIEQGDASLADLWHVFRGSVWDAWVAGRRAEREISATLAALDAPGAESAISVDAEARPGKRTGAWVVGVRVPGDVRISLRPVPGWLGTARRLHAAGHAAHLAGVDADLPAPRRLLGDPAVGEAYALLFEHLLVDTAWLGERLGMTEEDVAAFTDFVSLRRLWRLRRAAANLLYELRLAVTQETALARAYYAGLLGLLTGVRVPESGYLLGVDTRLGPARLLRGAFLEARLTDRLRAVAGGAWWRSPQAAETLRRAWRRGQGWRAEDVVAHLGYDRLDWQPVLRQIRTQLIGEMSGYGGPNITTRAGTRKV